MKAILPLLISSLFWCSCREDENEVRQSIYISTIVDITDLHLLHPDPKAILRLYGFDIDKSKAASFRISAVTDKQLNPTLEYFLPDNNSTEKHNSQDDPYYREKLVVAFYENIRNAVTQFNSVHHNDSSLRHSECFSTICNELHLMQKKGTTKNILLIFSDLQEKSNIIDSYSKANQSKPYKSPDKIAEIFNNVHLLPDNLKGYSIFFVYLPKDRIDDQKYRKMTTVYKMLLEPRGATVTIQATNNSYSL